MSMSMTTLLALMLSVSMSQPPTLQEARALLAAGDHAGAEAKLRAVTEANPADAQATYLLGYTLHAAGKLDEALIWHKKATRFATTRANASFNLACVLARQEKIDEAFAWIAKATAAGFDISAARGDSDLDNLRDDERFTGIFPVFRHGADAFLETGTRVLHEFHGEAPGDQYGWVARRIGDVDHDGVIDFATSAPTKRITGPACGRVYAYSSKSGKLLFQHDGAPGDQLGNSIAPAGDVNGDGTPDVLVGVPGSAPRAGRAIVLSGKDGAVLLEVSQGEAGDRFGLKCCGIGDIDGDGHADIAIGAPSADAGAKDSGRTYVYSGKKGELLYAIDGTQAAGNFGSSLDATHGGAGLLIVGAMTEGARNTGRAHVFRLSRSKAAPHFTIEGDATSANLGQYFVSILGDVDRDGVPDVYASDWQNSGGGAAAGRVYVHSGKTGERLLTITGHAPGEGFGTSPSDAGDVNGDGCADLIVGAWQNATGGKSAGKCYLHSGKDGSLLASYTSTQPGDTLGFDATGIGDVDGDGAIDFLLTSAWSALRGTQSGRVFIVAGPTFE